MTGTLREGHQLKGARAIAKVTLADLSRETGLSVPTLRTWESSQVINARSDNLYRVQKALEDRGVVFIDENGEGPGVRRRRDMPE